MFSSAFINQFNNFKEKTRKYEDLRIEGIEFDVVHFFRDSDNITFTGSKKIGNHEDIENIDDTGGLPVYDASSNILTYIHEDKYPQLVFEVEDNENPDISFASEGNSSAGTNFIIHENKYFVNNHRTVLKFSQKYYSKYVYYRILNMKKEFGFKRGYIPSQTELKGLEITIQLPKDLSEKYTSFNIQKAIVEFLDYQKEQTEILRKKMTSMQEKVYKTDKAVLSKIFEMKDSFIIQQFNKWAQLKSYKIDGNNIQFDIKRIIADNPEDTVCKKRMGFTPTRDPLGDINWFTVADLNAVDSMYINKPDTKEKTTIDLVKQTVDKNNTGKSEKLIPIQKGDILVSFLLTIGITKIYNSNKPAYCNQAIDIISPKDGYDNEYIAYNCILEYPKFGEEQALGTNLNDDSKKDIQIMIPKSTEQYTSLEIQKIIIEFFEAFNLWKNQILDLSNSIKTKCDVMDNAFLNEIFKGHNND